MAHNAVFVENALETCLPLVPINKSNTMIVSWIIYGAVRRHVPFSYWAVWRHHEVVSLYRDNETSTWIGRVAYVTSRQWRSSVLHIASVAVYHREDWLVISSGLKVWARFFFDQLHLLLYLCKTCKHISIEWPRYVREERRIRFCVHYICAARRRKVRWYLGGGGRARFTRSRISQIFKKSFHSNEQKL